MVEHRRKQLTETSAERHHGLARKEAVLLSVEVESHVIEHRVRSLTSTMRHYTSCSVLLSMQRTVRPGFVPITQLISGVQVPVLVPEEHGTCWCPG